ncbi:MAG: hypothetical protein KAI29_19435 [Cyclobacteriaceae bacterium]|nr:hypothetical protein [Cyclobacteriaceae bacterium]
MIKCNATGTVDYLQEGRRKYYFIKADVKDWNTWPFPSDAFPIHRGKSRNKKFKKGDRVAFKAIENKGDLRAWKIFKLWSESD